MSISLDEKNLDPNTVRLPELLAPAGGMNQLKAAIAAGADAIYLGLDAFNARASADNFTVETLEQACQLAHLAGVRIYVTLNITMHDDELADGVELARSAWAAGADAFIVADWGFAQRLVDEIPGVELHLSTQAGVQSTPGTLAAARELGFERVTTSRELNIEEMRALTNTGIDIEVFCHGAICICYSGCCELSAMMGGRSANRGRCAQPCRLSYGLVDEDWNEVSRVEGDKLLSPRDYICVHHLPQLIDAGVASLKIEGRMKNPDYVYGVVSIYRYALDQLAAGNEIDDEKLEHDLGHMFNRSFTAGYLEGNNHWDNRMMSYERSNNQGVEVGRLIEARGFEVLVSLSHPVVKGDMLEIRFYPDPDSKLPKRWPMVEAPRDAQAGEYLRLSVKRKVEAGCAVHCVRSAGALGAAQEILHNEYPRKRDVSVRTTAHLGEPLTIDLCDAQGNSVHVTGKICEEARTRPITSEDVIDHVGRFGTTPFNLTNNTCDIDDNIGMGFSTLHKLRAKAAEKLAEQILAPWTLRKQQVSQLDAVRANIEGESIDAQEYREQTPQVILVARTIDEVRCALADERVDEVAVRATDIDEDPAAWEPYVGQLTVMLPEPAHEAELEYIREHITRAGRVVCRNMSEVLLARDMHATFDVGTPLVATNGQTASIFTSMGARRIWCSPESSLADLPAITRGAQAGMDEPQTYPLAFVVAGRVQCMVMRHCMLNPLGPCAHNCADCARRTSQYYLRDNEDHLLPIETDIHGRSRIFDSRPVDVTPQMAELMAGGVGSVIVDAAYMSKAELDQNLNRVRAAIAAVGAGRRPELKLPRARTGLIFESVR